MLFKKNDNNMKSMKVKTLVIFCISLFFWVQVYSQETSDTLTYHIETNDGNYYQGKILSEDNRIIHFRTNNIGDISIQKTAVKERHIVETKKMKNGKYWMENPQSTRYFFSPNAFGLKSGEGYYQNVWVLVNSFAIGMSDYISVGGGIVPLFFFAGGPTPVWFTAKASIPVSKKNFGLGVGVLGGTVILEEESSFGILYGITTIGSKDNNVSLGLGYGYAGGNWAKSPMVNLNFMLRTGAKGYIISENYYIQAGESSVFILSAGGRSIIKKAGLDYGLIIPIFDDIGEFIAIPWLGITIPFGIKNK